MTARKAGSARPPRKPCSYPDCTAESAARDLCDKHYARLRLTGTTDLKPRPTPEQRFWAKVDKTDTCWVWLAATKSGYGAFHVDRRSELAHRYAYRVIRGSIPDGLQLDHLCRNRACVNPDHLEPVTAQENLLRGETKAAANAAKTHCPSGHPYSGGNVAPTRNGGRRCRACRRNHQRLYVARQRAKSHV